MSGLKNNVVIFSSSKFNEKEVLDKYKDEILGFVNKNIPSAYNITMGNFNNSSLIKFFENNGYTINIKKQHPNSLRPSNRKLINENDIILFLNYNSSKYIEEFIEFAKNKNEKKIFVFRKGKR